MKRTVERDGKFFCSSIVEEFRDWRGTYPSWYAEKKTAEYWRLLGREEKITQLVEWVKNFGNFAPIFW